MLTLVLVACTASRGGRAPEATVQVGGTAASTPTPSASVVAAAPEDALAPFVDQGRRLGLAVLDGTFGGATEADLTARFAGPVLVRAAPGAAEVPEPAARARQVVTSFALLTAFLARDTPGPEDAAWLRLELAAFSLRAGLALELQSCRLSSFETPPPTPPALRVLTRAVAKAVEHHALSVDDPTEGELGAYYATLIAEREARPLHPDAEAALTGGAYDLAGLNLDSLNLVVLGSDGAPYMVQVGLEQDAVAVVAGTRWRELAIVHAASPDE